MKRGSKLCVYLSGEVLDSLAVLSERFPDDTAPALVRRALSAYAAQVLDDARRERVGAEALRLSRLRHSN